MFSGVAIVLLFAAPAAAVESYGPALPPAPQPKKEAAVSACAAPPVDKDKGEIFVCAPRPEGYRIDPDVLKASKQARNECALFSPKIVKDLAADKGRQPQTPDDARKAFDALFKK